jgi:hypothetical protein
MTTINVTAEHIARGTPGECAHCPVALAIQDALPGLAGVAVGNAEISILPKPRGSWIEVDTPRGVPYFVLRYDSTGTGEPFSFDLDYPAEVAA